MTKTSTKLTGLTWFQVQELKYFEAENTCLELVVYKTSAFVPDVEWTLRFVMTRINELNFRAKFEDSAERSALKGKVVALHSIKRKLAAAIVSLTPAEAAALMNR